MHTPVQYANGRHVRIKRRNEELDSSLDVAMHMAVDAARRMPVNVPNRKLISNLPVGWTNTMRECKSPSIYDML